MRLTKIRTISLLWMICLIIQAVAQESALAAQGEISYCCKEYPLERNGISLHLDCVSAGVPEPGRQILLLHGSSYSSHEFDIDYQDYSLVRFLARQGYAVWRLDIAGYGKSGQVEDGFMPDTAYAVEDICAAADEIRRNSGQEQIDILGWSWGTMTAGLFTVDHPEYVRKLVLYAPILSGLGEQEVKEPFSHNTWEGAAEDFQKQEDGAFDPEITDSILIELFCSSCWHYDGDSSPNGWSRDVFVDNNTRLIDLERINVPTLVIYGSKDPYMNHKLLNEAFELLPEGSRVQEIEGGSHILMYEKPYYRDFQERVVSFLNQ